MSAESALVVNSSVAIPRSELNFRATRAGGPGGQHVNKASTRVELSWNLERSGAVTEDERALLRDRLAARVDGNGAVRVVASAFRSQSRNREDAETRLAALLRKALVVPKRRHATRPTKGSVEQRLRAKREQRERKRRRRAPDVDD